MNTDYNRVLEAPPTGRQRAMWTVGFVLIWWAVSALDVINALLLPSPFSVLEAVFNIGSTLVVHVLATGSRALVGLMLGTLCGVGIGLSVRFSGILTRTIEPMLDASRPVPTVALLPFFILIFGFSEAGRITLVGLSVAIIIAVATVEAAETIPERWFRFPVVSGFSRMRLFYAIVLPAIIPSLRGPLRIALSVSFTLVIASEFMGAQQGIGYLINVARINLATPTIVLCIFLLGAIAQFMDICLNELINRMTFWYQGARTTLRSE